MNSDFVFGVLSGVALTATVVALYRTFDDPLKAAWTRWADRQEPQQLSLPLDGSTGRAWGGGLDPVANSMMAHRASEFWRTPRPFATFAEFPQPAKNTTVMVAPTMVPVAKKAATKKPSGRPKGAKSAKTSARKTTRPRTSASRRVRTKR